MSERARYGYASALAATNASITMACLMWRHGTADLTVLVFVAVWSLLAVMTFGAALVFWRKSNRTRGIMALLSCLTVLTTYIALFSGAELANLNVGLHSFEQILGSLVDFHESTFGLPYVGALIVSLFFKSNDLDPREAF